MSTVVQKNIGMNEFKLNLPVLYYYSFLATFTIIVFVNILPSELVVITRPFVVFTSILSLILLNNIRAVLYFLTIYLFIFIYSLYPLITGDGEVEYLIKNTKYIMYFALLFGLVNIIRFISLERILYSMSKIFILKLLLVAIISLNVNFGPDWYLGYILNGIDLSVHKLFGVYRVLDVTLFLFPLILIFIRNKNTTIKIMIHLLLLFNIISSLTFGIIFAYIIVMFIRFRFVRYLLFFFVVAAVLIYFDYLLSLYGIFLFEKSISVEVKVNQFLFIFDNISLWGQGLGTLINIEGRVDSMIENLYIYWLVVYGIFGTFFIATIYIFLPFLICYHFKQEFSVIVLFYMHLSVLLVSTANPFFESVLGIIPMMLILSYFFEKRTLKSSNLIRNILYN